MSWTKATVRLLHAWRHPDEIEREVEAELRFHIERRTRANIESGMRPTEAQLAARQSFGDFNQVKANCCEISRSLPFDATVLKMGMYITIAVLAGGTSLWVVNIPHHNFTSVLWQLVAIAVLARAFIVGRRSLSTKQFAGDHSGGVLITAGDKFRKDKSFSNDVCEAHGLGIAGCEIRHGFPLNLRPLRMGFYIAIACLAGGAALVAVNLPHDSVFGVLWQVAAIAVLMRSFLVGRRKIKPTDY